MRRALWTVSAMSLLAAGCHQEVMRPKTASDDEPTGRLEVTLPAAGVAERAEPWNNPGDFVTVRLSGSYREAPVTITQRVVSRRRGELVVDMTIESRGERERLRLRLDPRGGVATLLGVRRYQGDQELPMTRAAYEKLMSEYLLATDSEATLLGSTGVTIELGGARVPCVQTSYRVRVGVHDAVMRTLSTKVLPWAHVGGDITTRDGHVLFKAEIVDLGNDGDESQVAATDEELYEDYLDD